MPEPFARENPLGTAELLRLGAFVAPFESAWLRGERPTLNNYLPDSEAERQSVLRELAQIDLEFRLKSGEAARVEEYLTRYPALADGPTARELIAVEFRFRRRVEPTLNPQEFLERFPHLAHDLSTILAGEETPLVRRDGARPLAGPRGVLAAPPEIPGYQILGEEGRGGMGVVYRARHHSLDRTVALKMVRPDTFAGPADAARFRAEAQAVARLQHPHIIQIYEVGEHDGRPFFALEFAAGGSLHQQWAGTPQPPTDAARLVETLARAVHAVHEQGIIHRDLKPHNILRTADGTPKITDFGLAKRQDREGSLSATGDIVGSPSYMPPEQAIGDRAVMSPLADVYGLGAILYEALTGRPPFKGATVLDTLEQVRSQEPVPPSRFQPKVPRDLETICLKCLLKEPSRRYISAEALADDLRRFLDGKPIQARPIGSAGRLWRWCRRNPRVAGLAAALLVSLLAGLATTTWKWLESDHHRGQAITNLERAESNLDLALGAVQDALIQVTGAVERAEIPHSEQLTLTLITDARQFMEKLAPQRSWSPQVRERLAGVHFKVGQVSASLLGRHRDAQQDYERALPLFQELMNEHPDDGKYRFALVVARNHLGVTLRNLNAHADAEKVFQEALADLAPLTAGPAPDSRHRFLQAEIHANLGFLFQLTMRPKEAEAAFRQAVTVHDEVADAAPENDLYQVHAAGAHGKLGSFFRLQRRWEEAEAQTREQLRYNRRLSAAASDQRENRYALAEAHFQYGTVLAQTRGPEAGRDDLQTGLKLLQGLAADYAKIPRYRLRLGTVLFELAEQDMRRDQRADAEKRYRETLAVQEEVTTAFPDNYEGQSGLALTLNRYFQALVKWGKLDEAKQALERGLAHGEKAPASVRNLPSWRQRQAQAHYNMGFFLYHNKQGKASESPFRHAIKLQEQLVREHPTRSDYQGELARSLFFLGKLLDELNRPDEAEPLYRLARTHFEEMTTDVPGISRAEGLHFVTEFLTKLLLRKEQHIRASILIAEWP